MRVWGLPWSLLGSVGNSGVAKATILIPIIGYMIIFNENLVQYFNLAKEVGGVRLGEEFTVSPRLLIIYFGLCAVAVGASLYSFFCPPEIKMYKNPSAYVMGDGPVIKEFALSLIANRLKQSPSAETYAAIPGSLQDKFSTYEDERAEIHNATLRLFHYHLDWSISLARHLAFLFYAIGFVCLAIPALGVFWRVTSILLPLIRRPFGVFF